ncbi:MAG: C25 family cysteine peptidase [Candidatus Krumholzibacteriia bacterium]
MRLVHVMFVLAVLSLVTGAAVAKSTLDLGTQPSLEVTADRAGDLTVRIAVGQLEFVDVDTKAGTFTRAMIPGFHNSQVVGQPALPMMNRLIAVPQGGVASVEVLNRQTRRVSLADAGVQHLLMPAQASLSKSDDPATAVFAFDQAAYQAAGLKALAPVASVVPQGRLRAVDYARLEVAPVRYDPVAGELEITESLELRVHFEGGSKAASQALWASTYSPFFEGLYREIDGVRGLHDSFPDHVRDEVTYVIVTPSMFTAQLQDFIAWKTERGFRVVVGEIGSPEVGTTTTSIQTYIRNLYNDATPDQPAPSFVLFVGDVAQCPTWQVNGDATDRPYCTIDGDYVPDIYYGRFSATNSSQLQAILDKTMMYDQFTMPDPSYLDEVVLIAGYDTGYGSTHGNGTINYGTVNYFNAAHGIDADVHLYPQSGSDDALIVSEVSQGRAFVNYTAHGSQTSWSDPTFTQANINSLQNVGKYGLAIGNCCLTSTYDYGECFAETFLRAPNKGMIGYIGASNSTYWDEDVWWATGYTANISANIPYESTDLGVYDALFHEHGESEDQWYVTQDAIVFCGNLAVQESGSTRTQYYWNIYNLMGDPSIAPYIGIPTANDVSHAPNLVANMTDMTVGADPGSYVGLSQNGVLIGAGTVHADGNPVTLTFRAALTAGAPAKLVVMAQNREPYIVELPVAAPSVVTISPLTLPAGVPTAVTVTVMENDGVTPIPHVTVQVNDDMEYGLMAMTDAFGQAQLTVDYPYGCPLTIVGTHPTEGFMFGEQLIVTGAPLASPDISVATQYGLVDVFGMNLESTITATTGTPGATLVAYVPDLGRLVSATGTIVTTPTAGGEVTAYILRAGYDLYRETFAVLTQGSVRGTVHLEGESDFSGVTITATPGSQTTTTAADGTYLLTSLDAGSYTITAQRDGFAVGTAVVSLDDGEHLGDVNFDLGIVYEVTECVEPALAIPDNNATGVTSTLQVTMSGEITSVRVFVDITHTYQGDLRVRLTSPAGTSVYLHDRSGGSADDILGWYPDDLAPAGNLDAFLGQEMQGTWSLTVVDLANIDVGTLNEWCVNLGYSGGTTTGAPDVPAVLTLDRNFPNPFNPQTKIGFALPQAGRVELAAVP